MALGHVENLAPEAEGRPPDPKSGEQGVKPGPFPGPGLEAHLCLSRALPHPLLTWGNGAFPRCHPNLDFFLSFPSWFGMEAGRRGWALMCPPNSSVRCDSDTVTFGPLLFLREVQPHHTAPR